MVNPLACRAVWVALAVYLPAVTAAAETGIDRNPLRNAYFGDLHVHTGFSFDASIFQVRTTPDDAYRFASGEPVTHPSGEIMRLSGPPLDFLAVTDHAEYLGVMRRLRDPDYPLSKSPIARLLTSDDPDESRVGFGKVSGPFVKSQAVPELLDRDTIRSAWEEEQAAADRHYQPGVFTTLKAFEFTASPPGFGNLHRNVYFRGNRVSDTVFSLFDSPNPEDLWRWMDALRADGIELLAIPHNSNWSNDAMFARAEYSGARVSASWAEIRRRNEPLAEITQIKGTSETTPELSPEDEWAEFGLYLRGASPEPKPASFVRSALLTGLALESELGVNPYRLGIIGSTDAHNSASTFEEERLFGFLGVMDGTQELRQSVPPGGMLTWREEFDLTTAATEGASGLAGVWAEENTREGIFDALARRETFATSGTRIHVRFFAGYGFTADMVNQRDFVATAYQNGVPMGGELQRAPAQLQFLIWAAQDPNSARLQRVQVIKGWLSKGTTREKVYDVACSDGLEPDPTSHRCPDNGARVNVADCSYTRDAGDAEFRTLWRDPEFAPDEAAFYYVRVLENPTCRWSTWDAIRAGTPPNPKVPMTIQERAWSSPIWFSPG